MDIILNGANVTFEHPVNIEQLLSEQGYTGKLVAVAVNGTFVARESYADHMISNQDQIEIVAPMQGG